MNARGVPPLAAAAAGLALGFAVTAHAPGVSADSTRYLVGAEALLAGEGFRGPAGGAITHYPPLYSVALGAGMAVGASPLASARAVGATCLAASAAAVALLAGAAGAPAAIALLVAATFLAAPTVLEVHAMVWSEPLFIALLLGALASLLVEPPAEPRRARRRRWLSAALAGAAGLTRWVGPAWIPALVVASAWPAGGRTRGRRVRDAALYAALAAAPLALWTLRNRVVGGSVANRALTPRPFDGAAVGRLFGLVGDLWLPQAGAARLALGAAGAALLVAGGATLLRPATPRPAPDGARALLAAALLATLGYLGFVVAAMTWVVGHIPATPRLVSPLAPFGPLALVAAGAVLAARTGRATPRHATAALLAVGVALAVPGAHERVRSLATEGRGYTGRAWSGSEAIARVAALPAHARVYSNARDLLEHASGRRVLGVPRTRLPVSHRPNPLLDAELADLEREMRHGHAVLVMLDAFEWRPYFPTAAELEERGLPVAERLADATVFGVSEAREP